MYSSRSGAPGFRAAPPPPSLSVVGCSDRTKSGSLNSRSRAPGFLAVGSPAPIADCVRLALSWPSPIPPIAVCWLLRSSHESGNLCMRTASACIRVAGLQPRRRLLFCCNKRSFNKRTQTLFKTREYDITPFTRTLRRINTLLPRVPE